MNLRMIWRSGAGARRLRFPSILLILLVLSGCAGSPVDDSRERKVALLIQQGKASLGRNEWSAAKAFFEEVLRDHDDTNNEARFGSALADILFLGDILRYVGSLGDDLKVDGLLPLATDDESRYLTELISGALQEVGAKFASAERHLTAVEQDAHFVFQIETLPLYLSQGKQENVELRGEWDRADALFLHGLVRVAMSAVNLLDSVDLNFDFPRAHAYFTQAEFDAANLSHLASLGAYILNDPANPDFLSVKGETGAETLDAASLQLAMAFADFERALIAASLERDEQQNDILRYNDVNGNGMLDPALPVDEDACAVLVALQAGPEGSKPESFYLLGMRLGNGYSHPHLNEQTVCLLQKLARNLAWRTREEAGARSRINVLHDVVPVLDALLAGVSAAVPKLTFGIPVPEGVAEELVASILGDVLELDLEPFFVADESGLPGNVRGLLPVWEKNSCAATGLCLNQFEVEMECSSAPATQAVFPAAFTAVFPELTFPACRQAWVDAGQVGDSSHFGGELAADGFVGYLPYIHWQDASLHGILYLNVAAFAGLYADSDDAGDLALVAGLNALDTDAEEFRAATLADFNAFTAALSSNSSVRSVLFRWVDQLGEQ